MKLPQITKEPINYVDSTPNSEYPIRILRSHLHNSECEWTDGENSDVPNQIIKVMNDACKERAFLLKKAIHILEEKM